MDGKTVTIGGVVTAVRNITTKNGARMAFVKVEDKTSECELIVFPGVYEKLNSVWEQDVVVVARCKINYKDRDGTMGQELKILVDQANVVSEEDAKAYQPKGKKPKPPKPGKPPKNDSANTPKPPPPQPLKESKDQTLFVQIKDPNDNERLLKLKETAHAHPGSESLVLVLGEDESKTALRMPFRVSAQSPFIEALKSFLEPECVILK